MATLTEQKEALIDARTVYNTVRALFNSTAKQLAAIPELGSAMVLFQAVADTASNHIQALRDAITGVGGIDATHATSEQQAQATALASQLTALLQHFEETTKMEIGGIVVDRVNGVVSVGDVVVVE